MNIEIINIGDELLIGQVVNTNASWMALELNKVGLNVNKVTTISDNAREIEDSINLALETSDCVLITGGLGPTKDDITKITLANMFESTLVENEKALENIKRIFSQRGYILSATNRKQALMPERSLYIENLVGTAAGMCFEKDNKLIISMPGVPFEMKQMMTLHVIPLLLKHYKPMAIHHKTIITQGIGESFLSDLIEDFEDSLPQHIRLAYLPSANMLRLRLSARGEDDKKTKDELNREVEELIPLIDKYFIGFDETDLSQILAKKLKENKLTIASAESCTGGNIAHIITSNAGASEYYKGSIIAYSNEVKINILGVDPKSIEEYGAVSQEVAQQMALGAVKSLGVDYAMATTGIAGPDGGSEEKPVGTVWVAVANKKGEIIAKKSNFASNRTNFIDRTSNEALAMLIRFI